MALTLTLTPAPVLAFARMASSGAAGEPSISSLEPEDPDLARPQARPQALVLSHEPAQVLWDIPLTFLPSIFSPAAMAHHVCTALLALLALRPYCAYYAPFFAGVG